jgi:hypothetical protein
VSHALFMITDCVLRNTASVHTRARARSESSIVNYDIVYMWSDKLELGHRQNGCRLVKSGLKPIVTRHAKLVVNLFLVTTTSRFSVFISPKDLKKLWSLSCGLLCAQVSHILLPLEQGFSTGVPRNPRVPRDIARGSAQKSIDNYYWIIISTTY